MRQTDRQKNDREREDYIDAAQRAAEDELALNEAGQVL
jgi:hypothetical protein